jgi:hypothetical protein
MQVSGFANTSNVLLPSCQVVFAALQAVVVLPLHAAAGQHHT